MWFSKENEINTNVVFKMATAMQVLTEAEKRTYSEGKCQDITWNPGLTLPCGIGRMLREAAATTKAASGRLAGKQPVAKARCKLDSRAQKFSWSQATLPETVKPQNCKCSPGRVKTASPGWCAAFKQTEKPIKSFYS